MYIVRSESRFKQCLVVDIWDPVVESMGLLHISRIVINPLFIPLLFEFILKMTWFYTVKALGVLFPGLEVVVSLVFMFAVSVAVAVAWVSVIVCWRIYCLVILLLT